MKKVTINVKFDVNAKCWPPHLYVEKVITRALRKRGIRVTKFRNTYCESKHGVADFPHELFLACLIDSPTGSGFSWKLVELSGKYTLTFQA